ncbi:MAG: hypothetical protein D6722_12955, partial [Bacteroidetes bacterium]
MERFMSRAANLICRTYPLLLLLGSLTSLPAQSGLVYGEVATIDDVCYQGVLRWGGRENFWDDLFVAHKVKVNTLDYLSGDEIKRLYDREREEKIDWSFMSLWRQPYPEHKHAFRCRFGDLAELEVLAEDAAELTFKDGSRIQVEEGRHLGVQISVLDAEEVEAKIDWGRIHHITFMPAPPGRWPGTVASLYGTVFTPQGAFEGFVIWDNEDSRSTDRLEGRTGRGKMAFPFGEIQQIRAQGEGAQVLLFSGRQYDLWGTDDVSANNHGIIVKRHDLGHVHIPWAQFRFVRFQPQARPDGPDYRAFRPPAPLRGRVQMQDGRTFAGRLILDLDEGMDVETIEGQQEGIDYTIPLQNVRRMERRNYEFSAITLHNGDKLFLGTGHDVSDRSWGILIWTDAPKPLYL